MVDALVPSPVFTLQISDQLAAYRLGEYCGGGGYHGWQLYLAQKQFKVHVPNDAGFSGAGCSVDGEPVPRHVSETFS